MLLEIKDLDISYGDSAPTVQDAVSLAVARPRSYARYSVSCPERAG